VLLALVVLLELRVLPGLIPPPALLTSWRSDKNLDRYPSGTQRVEVLLSSGEKLRGLFCCSDPGAPVMLHLLESTGSAFGCERALRDFADLGFSSLVLDYRGIGESDGSRSTRHLAEDARAMWEAALERTGGDSSLVVVRAISIGTLAAATLGLRGVQPAAWILIDPVRSSTVVENMGRARYGKIAARLAAPIFEPVVDAELEDAITRMREPLRVIAPRTDMMLLPAEQELLRKAAAGVGGEWAWSVKDHVWTCLGAHKLFDDDEARFLLALFPGWPDADARVAGVVSELPAGLASMFAVGSESWQRLRGIAGLTRSIGAREIAAAASVGADPLSVRRLLSRARNDSTGTYEQLDFDTCALLLDVRDPAGDLPSELIGICGPDVSVAMHVSAGCRDDPRAGLELVRAFECSAERGENTLQYEAGNMAVTIDLPCFEMWRALGHDGKLPIASVRRRCARVVFKALGIPDRVVVDPAGDVSLQVLSYGVWVPLNLDWPRPCSDEPERVVPLR